MVAFNAIPKRRLPWDPYAPGGSPKANVPPLPGKPGTPYTAAFDRAAPLAPEMFNPAQVQQLANRPVNLITRSANDRIRELERQLAGTGAAGTLGDTRDRILRDAAAQSAEARTAAELGATRENAAYALQRQDQENQLRGQDLQTLLGLGGLGVQARGQTLEHEAERGRQGLAWDTANLQAGVAGRGQDLEQMIAELRANVEQRGQDIGHGVERGRQGLAARGQDIDWLSRLLGADVEQRGQDISGNLTGRGQDIQFGLGSRGQELDYLLGGRGQDVAARSDALRYLLGGRGQDIDANQQTLAALAQALGIDAGQRNAELDYLASLYGIQNRDRNLALGAVLGNFGL